MQVLKKSTVHPYPLIRSGGLFLTIIGGGLITAIFADSNSVINKEIFIVSFFLAMTSLVFSKLLSFGRPTLLQYYALLTSIALEIALIFIANEFLPSGLEEEVLWLIGFIIVGIHFLPMTLVFGRMVLFLGIACILNGILGLLLLNHFNFISFGIVDGLFKLTCGLSLLNTGQIK